MILRDLPNTFDPGAVLAIDGRLDAIRQNDGVAIPLAIESGSRAWGFPSPDSDYDCRFIFVRPVEQVLSPWLRRDVIETPLEGDLDVNGWEFGKALKLLLKGNGVVIEWLRSPVMYGVDQDFRDQFLALANRVANPTLVARHHLHLGLRQRNTYFADHANVPQKKLFYALRPAATLRWMRLNPGQAAPPMHFPTLMEECDPPAELVPIVADLIARKAVTHELGGGPAPKEVMAFVDSEFAIGSETIDLGFITPDPEHRAAADAFFKEMTWRFETKT